MSVEGNEDLYALRALPVTCRNHYDHNAHLPPVLRRRCRTREEATFLCGNLLAHGIAIGGRDERHVTIFVYFDLLIRPGGAVRQ